MVCCHSILALFVGSLEDVKRYKVMIGNHTFICRFEFDSKYLGRRKCASPKVCTMNLQLQLQYPMILYRHLLRTQLLVSCYAE